MRIEINNRTKSKINLNLVEQAVRKFARFYKIKSKEVSIAFVGDAEIGKLNQTYRDSKEVTDVLAFAGDDELLGEIVIDYEQIKRQAGRFGNSIKAELVFVLAHGLLHLVGYDDETEAGRREMMKRGEEFVKN
jgi:probable rRNA maturation factor